MRAASAATTGPQSAMIIGVLTQDAQPAAGRAPRPLALVINNKVSLLGSIITHPILFANSN